MSVVKINALEIPPQAGDEIVKRFTARLDELSTVEGFEGFELLRPTGESEPRWFVYSRWRDQACYEAWRNSETFARGHAGNAGKPNTSDSNTSDSEAPPAPLAKGATLLEFEVAAVATPA